MNTQQLIERMVRASGRSMRDISISLGKSGTWLASTLWKGSDIRTSTLCDIARECGYAIIAEGRGDSVTLDPRELDSFDVTVTVKPGDTPEVVARAVSAAIDRRAAEDNGSSEA